MLEKVKMSLIISDEGISDRKEKKEGATGICTKSRGSKKEKRHAEAQVKANIRRTLSRGGTFKRDKLSIECGIMEANQRIAEYLKNLPGNVERIIQSHDEFSRNVVEWNGWPRQSFDRLESIKQEALAGEARLLTRRAPRIQEVELLSDSESDIEVLSETDLQKDSNESMRSEEVSPESMRPQYDLRDILDEIDED